MCGEFIYVRIILLLYSYNNVLMYVCKYAAIGVAIYVSMHVHMYVHSI